MAIGLGIGIGISIGSRGSASSVPSIRLSNRNVAETGGVVGTFSVSNSPEGVTWAFAITADPDSKFDIENDDELVADDLDFETATSHSVTIGATPSEGDPIARTFTIQVTNVIEAPVFLEAPVVAGDLDGILTCSTGVLKMPDGAAATFAYQWKDADDDSDLEGETDNTLDSQDHIGLEVYCVVTATNSADSTSEPSNTVGPLEEAETPPEPEPPSPFEEGDWSISPGNEQASVTINSLPDEGSDPITDIEYRIGSGDPVSAEDTDDFTIGSLTNDVQVNIQIRAVNGVGPGAWSDVKAVTPEDAGGVWTPANLPDAPLAWWDPTVSGSLWQDAAASTPANDGDPLGHIADQSGNGRHATQSTDAARPLFDVISGLPWMVFDNVDDWLSITELQPAMVAAVFYADNPVNFSMPAFSRSRNLDSNNIRINGDTAEFRIPGDGADENDYITSDGEVRINGVATNAISLTTPSILTSTRGSSASNGIASIGANTNRRWKGRMGRIVFLSAIPSSDDYDDLLDWLAEPYGISL